MSDAAAGGVSFSFSSSSGSSASSSASNANANANANATETPSDREQMEESMFYELRKTAKFKSLGIDLEKTDITEEEWEYVTDWIIEHSYESVNYAIKESINAVMRSTLINAFEACAVRSEKIKDDIQASGRYRTSRMTDKRMKLLFKLMLAQL